MAATAPTPDNVLPWRVADLEKSHERLDARQSADHDSLINVQKDVQTFVVETTRLRASVDRLTGAIVVASLGIVGAVVAGALTLHS